MQQDQNPTQVATLRLFTGAVLGDLGTIMLNFTCVCQPFRTEKLAGAERT